MSQHTVVVDMDGTLIRTDTLMESVALLLAARPLSVFKMPFWLMQGKSVLKQEIAERVLPDPEFLPYNKEVIDLIKMEKENGAKTVLCSGANQDVVDRVSEHLGLFSEAYGSSKTTNLTAENKASFLNQAFGENNYIYVGDSFNDLHVWEYAGEACVVSDSGRLIRKVSSRCTVNKVIKKNQNSVGDFLKLFRIHQWVKNLLIFVPLLTSHKVFEFELVGLSLLAFISFSLIASASYVVNDLLDLRSDRAHKTKKNRPLARGDIDIRSASLAVAMVIALSIGIGALLPSQFSLYVLGYVILTLSYSFYLKRKHIADIVTLACLYTLRLFIGGAALSVQPSFWLLAFSMFVFLSLSIVKRVAEIQGKGLPDAEKNDKVSGRGYYISDLSLLNTMACASGMISILVLALYINSPAVALLYTNPQFLWLICPVFGYWILRIVLLSFRGHVNEDPIVFAITDRNSILSASVIGVIALLAAQGI